MHVQHVGRVLKPRGWSVAHGHAPSSHEAILQLSRASLCAQGERRPGSGPVSRVTIRDRDRRAR